MVRSTAGHPGATALREEPWDLIPATAGTGHSGWLSVAVTESHRKEEVYCGPGSQGPVRGQWQGSLAPGVKQGRRGGEGHQGGGRWRVAEGAQVPMLAPVPELTALLS